MAGVYEVCKCVINADARQSFLSHDPARILRSFRLYHPAAILARNKLLDHMTQFGFGLSSLACMMHKMLYHFPSLFRRYPTNVRRRWQ